MLLATGWGPGLPRFSSPWWCFPSWFLQGSGSSHPRRGFGQRSRRCLQKQVTRVCLAFVRSLQRAPHCITAGVHHPHAVTPIFLAQDLFIRYPKKSGAKRFKPHKPRKHSIGTTHVEVILCQNVLFYAMFQITIESNDKQKPYFNLPDLPVRRFSSCPVTHWDTQAMATFSRSSSYTWNQRRVL